MIDEDSDGHIQTDEILLMITTAVEGDKKVDEGEARTVLENMEKDERGGVYSACMGIFILSSFCDQSLILF